MPNPIDEPASESPIRTRIETILVADDLTDASERVLDVAAAVAGTSGAQVEAVYVQPAINMIAATAGDRERATRAGTAVMPPPPDLPELEGRLEAHLDLLHRDGVPARSTVLHGSPASALVQHASEADADLIVVGSAQRRGVGRLMLGSVAEAVMRSASCPVLVVPLHPDKP